VEGLPAKAVWRVSNLLEVKPAPHPRPL